MDDSNRAQDGRQVGGAGKMYSAGQVAGAAFLGMPIAGAWLLAANYRESGKPALRQKALLFGALATVGLLVVAFLLPDSFPNSVLPLAYTFTIREMAKHFQGEAYESHISAGGLKHSSWRVAGIGVAWLVAILAIMMAVVLVLPAELFPDGEGVGRV